jgi:hypothetical protein
MGHTTDRPRDARMGGEINDQELLQPSYAVSMQYGTYLRTTREVNGHIR